MTKRNLILIVAILAAIAGSAQGDFKIEVAVQGYPEGTQLYLNDISTGRYLPIDSARLIGGKCSFSGNIPAEYARRSISTADLKDRASFWLQGGNTHFTAEKDFFKKAVIAGTPIQTDQNRLNAILDTAQNAEKAEYQFVKNNPNSVIAAYLLSVYCFSWEKDSVSALYHAFSENVKATEFAGKVADFIALNRPIHLGDPYVDFAQQDTAGKTVALSELSGKVILLEFWGSWCGPCREENPALVQLYAEFKSKGFEIYGVASETNRNQWIKAINADGLPWVNVTDLRGGSNRAAMIYGVAGYPSNFLIDRNGKILAKEVYGDDLRNWLLKIL